MRPRFARNFMRNSRSLLAKSALSPNKITSEQCANSRAGSRHLHQRCLVILIDEYDAPLTKCLTNRALFDEVLAAMNEFFLTLSSNVGCLRFFFVTGITRLGSKRLFSAREDLQDISLEPRYGTLIGFTEEELQKYFPLYIDQAADALRISRDTALEDLKANYGGYCFDEKALHRVYCPWSILSFLKRPDRGFQNYWFSSGGKPWVLGKYFSHHTLPKPIDFEGTLPKAVKYA